MSKSGFVLSHYSSKGNVQSIVLSVNYRWTPDFRWITWSIITYLDGYKAGKFNLRGIISKKIVYNLFMGKNKSL